MLSPYALNDHVIMKILCIFDYETFRSASDIKGFNQPRSLLVQIKLSLRNFERFINMLKLTCMQNLMNQISNRLSRRQNDSKREQ